LEENEVKADGDKEQAWLIEAKSSPLHATLQVGDYTSKTLA
jgi:hypothetical protein